MSCCALCCRRWRHYWARTTLEFHLLGLATAYLWLMPQQVQHCAIGTYDDGLNQDLDLGLVVSRGEVAFFLKLKDSFEQRTFLSQVIIHRHPLKQPESKLTKWELHCTLVFMRIKNTQIHVQISRQISHFRTFEAKEDTKSKVGELQIMLSAC